MAQILPSEFDLHIWKKPGTGGSPDLFTIGAWDGPLTIRSLCHILPIDEAVAVLRQLLETAGLSAPQDSGTETNHEPRAASGRR